MNPLIEHVELLDREVHVPDQPHKGVTFSSTAYGSSSVTIDFTRWVDMGYPNQIVAKVSPVLNRPASPATAAEAGAA